ncbi:MAG: dephospho-CoA kinase [Gammaproteobacteria bacterium]
MPYIVGLTGGIGSGKSAAASRFIHNGILVVDADEVAHDIHAQPAVLEAIAAHFGPEAITTDGVLNRRYLRQRVFDHDADRQWLEALLHPKIRERMQQELAQASSPYAILSAPLLLENGLDTHTNRILVIDALESQQLERAAARDHTSPEAIASIIAKQISRTDRLARADDVIDNSGQLSELIHAVDTLHDTYLRLAAEHASTVHQHCSR